jgi:23S rRNA maturation mini-RNase III
VAALENVVALLVAPTHTSGQLFCRPKRSLSAVLLAYKGEIVAQAMSRVHLLDDGSPERIGRQHLGAAEDVEALLCPR